MRIQNTYSLLSENATDDVRNYTLSRRKSLEIYKPDINHFSLDKNKKTSSNINQILKNQFLLNENYRLLAFKFESDNKPIFFRFNLPRTFQNLNVLTMQDG